ncbi:hypothetical protein VTN77DRAFT_7884 [Rasamsonia byssochlamydoides]|uniref:uncharacterized protein n=1 Tax=Rasamsonia byssochlamydoides TaxID=89139 RepID=UPI00374493E4
MEKPPTKKVRSACDTCHNAKMKCSGGSPCAACSSSGYQCRYSVSNRLGRPKGAKNKKINDHASGDPAPPPASTADAKANPAIQQPVGDHYGDFADKSLVTFDDVFVYAGSDNYSVSSYALSGSNSFWDPTSNTFVDVAEDVGLNSDRSLDFSPVKDHQEIALSSASIEQLHHQSSVAMMSALNKDPYFPLPNPQPGAINFPSMSRDPSSPSLQRRNPHSSPKQLSSCTCIQQHAKFFCRLKELDHSHNPLSISSTLQAAKHILTLWQRLVSCHFCQQDDDHGALLLSAMSIRTVLRRLQRFLVDQKQPGNSTPPESGKTTAEAASGTSSEPSRRSSHDSKKDLAMSPVKVGNFEVPEEEQMFVVDMLIIRTLGKMKYALELLRETIERGPGREKMQMETEMDNAERPTGRSSGFVPLMLEGLDESVRELEQSLRNSIAQQR